MSRRIAVREDGRDLTVLEREILKGRTQFMFEGARYVIQRAGLLGSFVLERDGRVIARAARQGFFARGYDVTAEDRMLALRAKGLLGHTFVLLHGDVPCGTMRSTSLFRRSATVDFTSNLPLPLRVFLAFLVLVSWQRSQRSAG